MNSYTSILEIIISKAQEFPDRLCLVDSSGEITYADYIQKIKAIASYLLKQGLTPGNYVVLKCTQNIVYLAALHAVQLAGCIAVPMEKKCGEDYLAGIIEKTHAAMFIGDKSIPSDVTSIMYSELETLSEIKDNFVLPSGEKPSLVLFTTGTTGASKGIVLRHSADIAAAENIFYGVKMKAGNVEILPMPLNHSYALRRYFSVMMAGGTTVILDGVLKLKEFFDQMDKFHATSIAMSPSALSVILQLSKDKLGDYVNQLDFVQLGSAPLAEKEKEAIKKLLPNSRLYNFYGSTEAAVSCILDFSTDEDRPNCIGRPTVNARVKLSEEEIPRLMWSGAMCMDCYWNEPEMTRETMKDGWVYTSDTGKIDENGLVYTFGRADDVINIGGQKVSPSEVENAARYYPGIVDCACISQEDKISGAVLKFFYEGDELDLSDFHKYLAQKVEEFKIPKRIVRVDKLPRTYNGKLDRKVLRTY